MPGRRIAPFVLAAALGGAARLAAAQGTAGCLPYGPDTVQLAGVLRREVHPGPPNFESVRGGDAPETGYYLYLARPICAAGGAEAGLGAAHAGVRVVQLVLDASAAARLRPAVNRGVRLRGTLFPAHTGHHHAPVLMDVAGGGAAPLPDAAVGARPAPRPR